jgi:CIC family chloride channel protein
LRTGRHGFAVVSDDGSLFGIVSLEDYRRATSGDERAPDQLTVREIATRDLVTAYPDQSVGTALRRMAPRDLSRLPVVARDDPRRLLGVVRRNDIVRAYEVGALRREEARHRAERSRALGDGRVQFVEITLAPDSHAAGKIVAGLGLPPAVVLVSVRRGRDLLIPNGSTELQAGDVVTVLCERERAPHIQAALNERGDVRPAHIGN